MRQIKKGSLNVSVDVYIIDSTTGVPELGVLFNTAGIDLEYRRDVSAVVDITEVTLAALTTAHTDGGFLEIGHGYYRLDVPDAAFATGASKVTIQGTVTGMIVLPIAIQLVDFDPEDAADLGLTNLDAAISTRNAIAPNTVIPPSVAQFNARTILAASYFDPAADTVANVSTVATLTGHTAQTADHTAGIADIPTVAEFNARTLASASYATSANQTTLLGRIIGTLAAGTHNPATAAQIAVLSDWIDGGRLDAILDLILADTGELQLDDYPARFTTIETLIGDLGSGSAGISVISESSVETVAGTPTNTYAVTNQLNGVYHIVPDDGLNATDMYYQFDVGTFGVPIEIEWVGYAQGNNDTYDVYLYNWVTASWDQEGFITGTSGTTEQQHAFTATVDQVGTGGDLGKVRCRFLSSDGAVIATDRILCDYTVVLDTSVASILEDTGTTIPSLLPAALVGGRMDSDIGAKTGNVALSAQEKLDVNTEADTALTDYDGPTNAEMIARTILSAAYFDPAVDTVATVTNLTNLPTIPTNWITAAGITAAALNGKGDWNVGKTGYSISGTKTTLDALNDIAANDVLTSVTGTADSGTTTTLVDAARTEGDTDYWKGGFLLITSGTISGQIRRITGFNFTTDTLTVDTAFTQAIGTNTYSILKTGYGEAPAAGSGDWSTAEKEQVRSALGVDGTKTAATGGQLQALDTVADGIQTDLSNGTDGLGALKTGIDAIPTTAMRGTDSVPLNPALATDYTAARAAKLDEITAARLSELDAANLPTDIAAVLLDTGTTLDGKIDVIDALIDAIKVVTDAQARAAATIVDGAAIAGTLSTTQITTDITVTVAEQYTDRAIVFAIDTTTAALRGQGSVITATEILNSRLTFEALTTAPVATDTFSIV